MITEQRGRSMLEMLGVLAIVGILSLGAVSQLGKIFTRYQNMQIAESFGWMVREVLFRFKEFRQLQKQENLDYNSYFNISKYVEQLSLLPAGWYFKSPSLYNKRGTANFYLKRDFMQINYTLGGAHDGTNSKKELCRMLFLNVAQPMASDIYLAEVAQGNDILPGFYGDLYCGEKKRCLSSAGLDEIEEQCTFCADKPFGCAFVMFFYN